MSKIYIPGAKELLWNKMHNDLRSFIPHFPDGEIMCPACLRHVKFEDLSIEHIIAQQAVNCDPIEVRKAIARNQRSGLTLLCEKRLVNSKGKVVSGNGCNGWKGKYFDGRVRQILNSELISVGFNSRHHLSILSVGYLALFSKYGYRVALSASGLLMRKQYFSPFSILKAIPYNCQVVLGGQPLTEFTEENDVYWSDPFKITIENGYANMVLRSMAFSLPLSEDPTVPLARMLQYVPPKYRWRPNLETAFQ
jgi:hypothetical protein